MSSGFTFGRITPAAESASGLFGSSTAVTTSSTSTSTTSSATTNIFTVTQTISSLDSVSSTDKETKKTATFQFGQKPKKDSARNSSGNCRLFPKLEVPWRRVEWTEEEKASLLEKLSSYIPSSRDVPQARVLLLGPVGSGKSSFISSVQSMLDGRVTTRAMVGSSASSSFTRKLQSFLLSAQDNSQDSIWDSAERPTALELCDTMGFGDGDQNGPTLQHMISVIKGHAPEGYKFRPEEALSSDTEGYIKRPGLRERMHCVAFVLDASKVLYGSYSKGITSTFQQLRFHMSDMGVHQVVLLTHVDEICQETAKDTSEVYGSICVRDTINKAAALVGVSPSSVVPVRNYWCELEPDLSTDVLLLKALDHILLYTELFFREGRHTRAPKDKQTQLI